MGRSCRAPAKQITATAAIPAAASPARARARLTVTASATIPARTARPASSSACAPAGGYPASGPGSDASWFTMISHGTSQMAPSHSA